MRQILEPVVETLKNGPVVETEKWSYQVYTVDCDVDCGLWTCALYKNLVDLVETQTDENIY